jgi:hypothetical protein
MTLAACAILALLVAIPFAANAGPRPLAKLIAEAWTPERAEAVISYCIGGR